MQAREHAVRVGERPRVPLEVAPVELAHPEAVEVEHAHGELACGHLVDEPRDRGLVVVGREGGREPQAVRPGRHLRGPADELGVPLEHARGRAAVDHEVLERLAGHRELHALDRLGPDLVRDVPGVVHEHAVAAIGEVEGHVLVRLLRRRAAVGVPDVDRLAVLDERSEPLAQPVDEFTDAQRQLLQRVRGRRGADGALTGIAHGHPVELCVGPHPHVRDRLVAGRHDRAALGLERDPERRAGRDARRQPARGERAARLVDHDDAVPVLRADQVEALRPRAADVVVDAHADHVGQRRRERHREQRPVQGVAALGDDARRGEDLQAVLAVGTDVVRLAAVERLDARPDLPEPIGELHGRRCSFRTGRRSGIRFVT